MAESNDVRTKSYTFLKEAVKVVNSLLVHHRAEWPTLLMECYQQSYNTWILPPHCVSSDHVNDGAYIPAASKLELVINPFKSQMILKDTMKNPMDGSLLHKIFLGCG